MSIIVATHDRVLTQQSTHNIIIIYSSSNISHAHALFVYYYDVHVVYMVDVYVSYGGWGVLEIFLSHGMKTFLLPESWTVTVHNA